MKEIPQLDNAGLRHFALTTSAILVVLFGGLLPWVLGFAWPLWPWPIAAVLSVWGLLWPAGLKPVYQLWMRFGLIMGVISSHIVLGVMFFVLFMPMGIIMRLLGKDPLQKTLDTQADSYRKLRQPYNPKSMERPF